jgi:hypothetical protein
MAPVSQVQATKASVEHAGIDSRSLEEPEAALSFGPIFFVSRAARIRLVPLYNVPYTIEPVAASRPVV